MSGTAIADSFPNDGSIVSQDNAWTGFALNNLIVTNHIVREAAPLPAQPSRGRADVSLGTSDHYAQATAKFVSPSGNAGAVILARVSASTESGYSWWVYTSNGGTSYFAGLYSFTNGLEGAGLGTDVNVTSLIGSSPHVLRLEVAGVSPNILLVGYIDGTPIQAASAQTAFDGNTRTGLGIWLTTTQVEMSNFSAGDLLTSSGSVLNATQPTVLAAIDLASTGGTVTIPACDQTWIGNMTVTKQVQIQGAGIDVTVIHDNRDQADVSAHGNPQLFTWTVPNNGQVSSMSGITWYGYGWYDIPTRPNDSPTNGMLYLRSDGSNNQFRLHHCKFLPRRVAGMRVENLFGVVDHCYFDLWPDMGPAAYCFLPAYLGVGWYGDNSWAQPSTLGTANAMYFEDNNFIGGAINFYQFSFDGWFGMRTVFRHNTVKNTQGGQGHGTESGGRERGLRHIEVYENDVTYEAGSFNSDTWTGFRGGTGMIFNNRIVVDPGAGLNRVANIGHFRASTERKDWHYWGRCLRHTVTLTSSGTTATLTTSGADHGLGDIGDGNGGCGLYLQIVSATDARYNGIYPVLSVSGSTVARFTTAIGNLNNATGTLQTPWDGNTEATTGYPGMDQAGHGRSDYLGGAYDIPLNLVTWPNQLLEPAYAWNNTIQLGVASAQDSPMVIGNAGSPTTLVEGRDFYNTTPPNFNTPSGYTPLVYPHPLVTAGVVVGGGAPPTGRHTHLVHARKRR